MMEPFTSESEFSFESEENQEKNSQSELTHLANLAQKQLDLIMQLHTKFKEAKDLSSELNELRLKTIPKYMESIGENGINDITVKDSEGNLFPISIEKKWTASLTKVKKPLALAHLIEKGYGEIIKKTITFKCDASEGGKEEFEIIKECLIDNGFINFEIDESIHASTLKKFIKEQVEAGNDKLDLSLFSAFEVKQSVIDNVKIPDFTKVK